MESLVLEMTVNTKLVTTLNNIISVGAEYIDVSANDNECIFSTEYKGLIFAGKIPLTKRISKCDLRIPSQILKQITSDYSLVKFFIETEVINVFLYKEDITMKPIKIEVRKSISNLWYANVFLTAFNNPDFGRNSILPKCMPALRYLSSISTGLPTRNFLITNGILFIDSPIIKFFANLNVDNLNITLPADVMKYFFRDKNILNSAHEIVDSYHVLKSDNFVYCWKAVRSIPVQEYEVLKSMKPELTCVGKLENATRFIRKLKIAANREQSCIINFPKQMVTVQENNILVYDIPIEVKCDRPSEEVVRTSLRELLAITKDIEAQNLIFNVHKKFMEIYIKKYVEGFGELEVSFVLKQTK